MNPTASRVLSPASAAALAAALLPFAAAPLAAQDDPQQAAAEAFRSADLQSADPVTVAWAAWRASALVDPAAIAAALQPLREALGRLREQRTENAEQATLQLLHALAVHGADLPAGELRFRADGLAYATRIALLLRSSDPKCLDLLCDEFEALDPAADLVWEAIGDHLVGKRHARAIRAITAGLRPRLWVLVGKGPGTAWMGEDGRANCASPQAAAGGQPPFPSCRWLRQDVLEAPRPTGLGFAREAIGGWRAGGRVRYVTMTAPKLARARWVFAAAGIGPVVANGRSPCVVELPAPASRAAAAAAIASLSAIRADLDARLTAAHRALATLGLAPQLADWRLGDENVRLVDLRPAEERETMPLPALSSSPR